MVLIYVSKIVYTYFFYYFKLNTFEKYTCFISLLYLTVHRPYLYFFLIDISKFTSTFKKKGLYRFNFRLLKNFIRTFFIVYKIQVQTFM